MSEILRTEAQLEAIYERPVEAATVKEVNWITPHYRAYIEASPYAALATSGPEGLDCSPRGDRPGFVRVHDEKTLMLPDRRGNNRIDSLRNIVRDPRVALLFMIPGVGNTLRVNGRAHLSIAPDLLESFAVDEKAPRSVTVIEVDAVYFQCARALVRSELWNPARHVDPKSLPSAGQILAALSDERVGGETYDREWPGRAAATMW
ncbi:pyridoxamine 5'-phosphate oxidase family protein [Reyranella sp.]|uniref:pyridoxamine 5'-phosphate oxidase family protein n=1 Tax=Reyranella sp. TaxID=1929291 RepID=UPI002717C865|nr:pyridoxamine 5'-phosphate oxidase family protein [Reyranella sp.]MDO8972996.1 pyridoxamine 5'-phosphate oxidase family protein [Reyranella sp.]MDP3242498.1 pyridoxamine 5'-phosphate oxidase family protein [Reyranella sp.]